MEATNSAPTVESAEQDWAYGGMAEDFKAGRDVWREVSEGFAWQALEVLPPMDWHGQGGGGIGAFLVMEPQTHTRRGAVHSAFVQIGARYFARDLHRCDFRAELARLRAVVLP